MKRAVQVSGKSDRIARAVGEPWLDYQLRKTKRSLTLINEAAVESSGGIAAKDAQRLEFDMVTRQPYGRNLWLVAKLMILYLVKGFGWFLGKVRHVMPKPDRRHRQS